MKFSLLLIVLTSFFYSCSKSLDAVPETTRKSTLGSRSLVRKLDSAVLTVTIEPVIACYSYANGAIPRPCDISVEIRCELSRPIQSIVTIELAGPARLDIPGRPSTTQFRLALIMAPGTRKVIITTKPSSKDSQYASDTYTITNVSVHKLVH